jgi:hypothetical protein
LRAGRPRSNWIPAFSGVLTRALARWAKTIAPRRGGKDVAQCVSTGNNSARTSSPGGAKERIKDSYAPNGATCYVEPYLRREPWATIFRPSGPENVETPEPPAKASGPRCRLKAALHWHGACKCRNSSCAPPGRRPPLKAQRILCSLYKNTCNFEPLR